MTPSQWVQASVQAHRISSALTTCRVRTAAGGVRQTGPLTSVTDPLARSTTFDGYDLARRRQIETLPGGRSVVCDYDASGNLTSVQPPPITPAIDEAAILPIHLPGWDNSQEAELGR